MKWQETVLELEALTQVEEMEEKLKQIASILEMPQEKELDLRFCLLEAVHNGFIHGNREQVGKKVMVKWQYRSGEFIFAVTDEGEGFKPEENLSLPEDALAEEGRGVALLNLILDKVWYNESGNTIYGQLTWLVESGGKV